MFHPSFNTSHVTLYLPYLNKMYLSDIVSIHLMLLFIRSVVNPCYKLDIVSIHLMLLFIPAPWEPPVLFLSVSIHLMLLFIAVWWRFSISTRGRFNTSHVTLYRGRRSGLIDMDCCFNTSHVTLYRVLEIRLTLNRPKFQYISCYSLSALVLSWRENRNVSIHLMLLFIVDCKSCKRSFSIVSIHLMLLFIEIMEHRETAKNCVSIHLMLLFIWYRMQGHLFPNSRFNTSHVTLYHISLYPFLIHPWVSIHLMLLFITVTPFPMCLLRYLFQYISCYSLSFWWN